ncbi:MAG: hypothetical protein QOD07_1228 [Frankiaceae bacterium]|jgi:hypothetical protein|nr:hypothetical protein [Frankiaceae bacterium]
MTRRDETTGRADDRGEPDARVREDECWAAFWCVIARCLVDQHERKDARSTAA